MSLIEIIAVIFSLISVILTIKQNIWCWLTGIIGIIAYFFIFFEQKLYCEMLLQVIFIVQSVYGWVNWGNKKEELPVIRLDKTLITKHIMYTTATCILFIIVIAVYFKSSQPVLDVTTTGISLLATWYLTEKYLQAWHLWILVDVLFIIMFAIQGLYLSLFLYIIFLFLAIQGLIQWEKVSNIKTV